MPTFSKRILFVGFGAVARCTMPILLKHIDVDPRRITIIDFDQNDEALRPWIARGMTYVKDKVARENLDSLLSKYLSAGDLLIDLAWNIDCNEILQWCHDRGVLYINTSVELWDPASPGHHPRRTLYWRHERPAHGEGRRRRAPLRLEHGANLADQPFHEARPARHRGASARREKVRRGPGRKSPTTRKRWSSTIWPTSLASR